VIALPPGTWKVQRLAPDGRRAGVTNGTDLWVVDLARAMPTRFAPTMSTEATMAWSPDGRQLAFVSKQTGRAEIFVGSADGAGSPELVPTTDAAFKFIQDWSPDGKFIVFEIPDPQTGPDLWLLPMTGDRKPELYLKTSFVENDARVSPDGHWLVYDSNETGGFEIYVQSFPKPGHKVRVSSDGGVAPNWSRAGKELLYLNAGTMMSVPVEAGDEFRPGTPKPLFKLAEGGAGGDLTADGERFLISAAAETPHREIQLFLNWTAGLPR
jgi:Tol biopolymer transport system component